MAFLKRLGWYLMGMSIGIVFLMFFLKRKSGESQLDFCYMPNCRVLKNIRSKTFVFKDKENLVFNQLDSLSQQLLLNGDVDFNRSDPQSEGCKTYVITTDSNPKIALRIKNCEQTAYLEQIEL